MKARINIILSICLVSVFQQSDAQTTREKSWGFKGYLKDLQSVSFVDNADSVITANLIHNRINFKWNLCGNLFTRIELRNRIFYGENVKLIPGFGKYISEDAGYFDLTRLWVNERSILAVSALDRLLINYSSEKFSITAGRQRINWGINNIWNTNDLFNAYNFLDYDYEERPGFDAVRVQFFPRAFYSVELAYKPSASRSRTVAAALLKFNKWKYDFQVLGGIYHEDLAVGAGWAGNIKEAGIKGEVTYFRDKNNFSGGIGNFTGSVLLDYAFTDGWYISASMLYVERPLELLYTNVQTASEGLSAKNLMPYRYSFYAGVVKSISPILSLNAAVVYSPENNATIFFPSIAYSVAADFDMDLTAQCFFSDQAGVYRTSGNTIFLRMKWSF